MTADRIGWQLMDRLNHTFKPQAGPISKTGDGSNVTYARYTDAIIRKIQDAYRPDATIISARTVAWEIANDPETRGEFPDTYTQRTLIVAASWVIRRILNAQRITVRGEAYILPVPVRNIGGIVNG